jgi:hypothetical protein
MYSDGKSDPLTFRVNLSAARSEGEGRWGGRGRARREGSAGRGDSGLLTTWSNECNRCFRKLTLASNRFLGVRVLQLKRLAFVVCGRHHSVLQDPRGLLILILLTI